MVESETDYAIRMLSALKCSVVLRKLGRTTNLRDLGQSVLKWLLVNSDESRWRNAGGRYRLVEDLDHDVWICTVGRDGQAGCGKTLAEAVNAVLQPNQ